MFYCPDHILRFKPMPMGKTMLIELFLARFEGLLLGQFFNQTALKNQFFNLAVISFAFFRIMFLEVFLSLGIRGVATNAIGSIHVPIDWI